jgi:hypothetical protein
MDRVQGDEQTLIVRPIVTAPRGRVRVRFRVRVKFTARVRVRFTARVRVR